MTAPREAGGAVGSVRSGGSVPADAPSPAFRVCLIVLYDLGRLSPNLRLHPQERRRRERTVATAARLAYFQAGAPELAGRVRVTLVVRRGRASDPDHLLTAAEKLINVLFCRRRNGYGITEDDSARWVEWAPVQQETGAAWKGREEVRVLVEATTPGEEG